MRKTSNVRDAFSGSPIALAHAFVIVIVLMPESSVLSLKASCPVSRTRERMEIISPKGTINHEIDHFLFRSKNTNDRYHGYSCRRLPNEHRAADEPTL